MCVYLFVVHRCPLWCRGTRQSMTLSIWTAWRQPPSESIWLWRWSCSWVTPPQWSSFYANASASTSTSDTASPTDCDARYDSRSVRLCVDMMWHYLVICQWYDSGLRSLLTDCDTRYDSRSLCLCVDMMWIKSFVNHWCLMSFVRVTMSLESLEMSGRLTAVREKSCQGKLSFAYFKFGLRQCLELLQAFYRQLLEDFFLVIKSFWTFVWCDEQYVC